MIVLVVESGDSSVPPVGECPRWRRFILRILARKDWHLKGIALNLVQKPELRFLPYPYPAVKSCADWRVQVEFMMTNRIWPRRHLEISLTKMTITHLGACLQIRDRVGFRQAFLEDAQMSMVIGMGIGFTGQRAAVQKAVQKEAREEAQRRAAQGQQLQLLRELIGPRGGLPTLRGDLLKLATILHIPVEDKDTVPILRTKCRPAVTALMAGLKTETRSAAGMAASKAAPQPAASKSSPPTPGRSELTIETLLTMDANERQMDVDGEQVASWLAQLPDSRTSPTAPVINLE